MWFWKLDFIFVVQLYRRKRCSPAEGGGCLLPGNPCISLNSFTAYGLFWVKGEDLRIAYNAGCPTVGIFIGGNVRVQKKVCLWLTVLQITSINSASLISMGYT